MRKVKGHDKRICSLILGVKGLNRRYRVRRFLTVLFKILLIRQENISMNIKDNKLMTLR